MLNELDAMCVRERYADLLRAAEHERIITEVRAQHWEQIGLYRRALLRLGMLLVAAGEHLQLASHQPYRTKTEGTVR